MKFLIFLAFTLFTQQFVSAQPKALNPVILPETNGDFYTLLDSSALTGDEYLNQLLNFGVDFSITEGMTLGELSNDNNYTLGEVKDIGHLQGSQTVVYYTVTLKTDDAPDSGTEVLFEVFDDPSTGERITQVLAFPQLLLEGGEEDLESLNLHWRLSFNFYQVDASENVRGLLGYGIQGMIAEGLSQNILTSSEYTLDNLYSAVIDVKGSATYYRFSMSLILPDAGEEIADTTLIVKDDPINQIRQLVSYRVVTYVDLVEG